jgi:hypothetical protein
VRVLVPVKAICGKPSMRTKNETDAKFRRREFLNLIPSSLLKLNDQAPWLRIPDVMEKIETARNGLEFNILSPKRILRKRNLSPSSL